VSSQYLTNVNPPPAQSALEYDVEPSTVYLSTTSEQLYANLNIIVTNTTNASVNCMDFQFGFLAGSAQGNLTTVGDAGSVTPVSDQSQWEILTSGFSDITNPNLYLFKATPSGIEDFLPLAAGASLVFHLNNILVDQSVGEGTAFFTIIEGTGTNRSARQLVRGTIDLTKATSTLAITKFNVNPPTPIVPGTPITLSWQVTGSDHWQVTDQNTEQVIYDSNTSKPPGLSSWPVPPQQLTPQHSTTYELIAWAGNLYTTATATAQVMAAMFTSQPTASPQTVDAPGNKSMLRWNTLYASQLRIVGEGLDVTFTAAEGQYDIFPQAPGNQYAVYPESTNTYTLSIEGPNQTTDSRPVSVDVKGPVPIVDFTATPEISTAGQSVSLKWTTSWASSNVTLDQRVPGQPDSRLGTGLPQQDRNYQPATQPVAFQAYVLTAYGQGDQTAVLRSVVRTAGQLSAAEILAALAAALQPIIPGINWATYFASMSAAVTMPQIMADDGTNIWLQFQLSVPGVIPSLWVMASLLSRNLAQPQMTLYVLTIDGEKQPPVQEVGAGTLTTNSFCTLYGQQILEWFPAPPATLSVARLMPVGLTTPQALLSDGRYFWAGNSSSIIRWDAFSGTQHGNTIAVGCIPNGLVSDGLNMWACQQGGIITKIRISDGTVLGNFTMGTSLTAIFFDGTYIWVADQTSKSITKIKPSDGSVVGQPINVGAVVGQFACDGLTLWMTNDQPANPVAQVSAMRVSDNTPLGGVPVNYVPGLRISILFDGTYLWVGDGQALTQWVVNAASQT
jgi:hypothetical protein